MKQEQEFTPEETKEMIREYNTEWEHCYHWYEDRELSLPPCLPHNRVQSCKGCCPVWHKNEPAK